MAIENRAVAVQFPWVRCFCYFLAMKSMPTACWNLINNFAVSWLTLLYATQPRKVSIRPDWYCSQEWMAPRAKGAIKFFIAICSLACEGAIGYASRIMNNCILPAQLFVNLLQVPIALVHLGFLFCGVRLSKVYVLRVTWVCLRVVKNLSLSLSPPLSISLYIHVYIYIYIYIYISRM